MREDFIKNSKRDSALICPVVSVIEPAFTFIMWSISYITSFLKHFVLTRKVESLLICFNVVT